MSTLIPESFRDAVAALVQSLGQESVGPARQTLLARVQAALAVDAEHRAEQAQLEVFRQAARSCATAGESEIDVDATVSVGDDPGAYVASWTWVSDEDVVSYLVSQFDQAQAGTATQALLDLMASLPEPTDAAIHHDPEALSLPRLIAEAGFERDPEDSELAHNDRAAVEVLVGYLGAVVACEHLAQAYQAANLAEGRPRPLQQVG